MKKEIGKKPARKARLKVDRAPDSAPAICDGSVKVLALECWRIRKLIPEFAGNRKHLVLQTSVDKMIDALAALGVAIDDPEGSQFRDGMTLNVAVFDHSDQLEIGERIVSETLSPNIYIRDKLANTARVIVSVGRKDDVHGTQND
jgi:hypothetical protein